MNRGTYRKPGIPIPSVEIESREVVSLLTYPDKLEDEVRQGMIAGMISMLREKPPTHLAAVELVFNLLVAAVPEMRKTLGQVRTVSLSPKQLSKREVLGWMGMEEVDPAQARPSPLRVGVTPHEAALGVTNPAAVYSGVAAVLFAIGRQASEQASVSALEKRPDALVRRFDLAEEDRILLPNREAGPSREGLEMVYNSFANYSELRSEIVRFFLGVRRSQSHYPLHLEVLMTNFNLMRGSGMTHVDAVLRLAEMHPWSIRVAKLTPYFVKFAHELEEFAQLDPDVRQYHRLLVGQSDFLFLSSEYRPLIAVAASLIEEVESSFGRYVANKETYADLIEEVKSYAPQYKAEVKLTDLATMLGIVDVPLPKRQEKEQNQEQELV